MGLAMDEFKASPLAKKLAAEKGIDIHNIQGSGDGGKIIKSDIDNINQARRLRQRVAEVKHQEQYRRHRLDK
jgi:pyruvate/2-oxoglutarate dehydrogenase complex dihydrolipoamide acyltransferase (E2) component